VRIASRPRRIGRSKIAGIDDFLGTNAKLLHQNKLVQQRRWRKETFMSNMSEYRFRHIVTDLSDCEDAIDELFNGVTDDGQPLSDDELRAARRLVTSCIDIVARVAGMAHIAVNLDGVEESIDTVLRKANSAPLEARYDARDARVLLSKAAK
jgi:DNA-binding phage protein